MQAWPAVVKDRQKRLQLKYSVSLTGQRLIRTRLFGERLPAVLMNILCSPPDLSWLKRSSGCSQQHCQGGTMSIWGFNSAKMALWIFFTSVSSAQFWFDLCKSTPLQAGPVLQTVIDPRERWYLNPGLLGTKCERFPCAVHPLKTICSHNPTTQPTVDRHEELESC